MNTRLKTTLPAIVGLIFILISCSPTPNAIVDSLSQAQKCMEAYPDSALKILQEIPSPEKLHGKAQADYALLMTQAMHKNNIKYTSDSLISIALEYYDAYAVDPVSEGKTFFYYGKVMQALDNIELAMKYYLKAKDILDDTKEYKILGLIEESVGDLNWSQKLFREAVDNYKIALKYYSNVSDSLCISFANRNIARGFISEGKVDSAFCYYNKALNIASLKGYSSESSILRELGGLSRSINDYSKAESYFLTSIKREKFDIDLYRTYLSLGYLYAQYGEFNKAEAALKKCLEGKNDLLRKDAYECLYHLERNRNKFAQAVLYKDKSDSLLVITHNRETQEVLAELQQKYKSEKLQKENLQVKTEKQNSQLIAAILIFLISIVGIYYYLRFKNNRARMKEISKQILENEIEIRRLGKEIEGYQEEYSKVQESSKSKISELIGEMTLLVKQNRKLNSLLDDAKKGITPKEDSKLVDYISAFRILFLLRTEKEIPAKWTVLYPLVDFLYRDFVSRLQMSYDELTKHDLEICILLKFGFTKEELRDVFHITLDGVIKAKKRLKKRLKLAGDEDLDLFVRNY